MAKNVLKVEFPKGRIYVSKSGNAYIKYNKNYVDKFNTNLNRVQVFVDNRVVGYLQRYVSLKTGTQEKSIRLATDVGSGIVTIGVPYAEYQAYSTKIRNHSFKDPLRGRYPFERMKADKKAKLLKDTTAYSRRING